MQLYLGVRQWCAASWHCRVSTRLISFARHRRRIRQSDDRSSLQENRYLQKEVQQKYPDDLMQIRALTIGLGQSKITLDFTLFRSDFCYCGPRKIYVRHIFVRHGDGSLSGPLHSSKTTPLQQRCLTRMTSMDRKILSAHTSCICKGVWPLCKFMTMQNPCDQSNRQSLKRVEQHRESYTSCRSKEI